MQLGSVQLADDSMLEILDSYMATANLVGYLDVYKLLRSFWGAIQQSCYDIIIMCLKYRTLILLCLQWLAVAP